MVTSYLQLGDRLSQIWLNKYTLCVTLVIAKLTISITSLQNQVTNTQQLLEAGIKTLELNFVHSVQMTPFYLNELGNFLIKESVEGALDGSLKLASLLISAAENVAKFMFDFYFGTYICLATSAVDGAVDVATNTTEKLIDFVNGSLSTVSKDLSEGVDELSDIVNKIIKAVAKIESLVTGDKGSADAQFKSVELSIGKLQNLTIPSSIDSKLEALSQNTPNFDTVMNRTQSEIAKPFELARSKIASLNVSSLVPRDALPAAQTPQNVSNPFPALSSELKDLCIALNKSLNITLIVITAILALVALAAMIPIAFSEMRQWFRLQQLKARIDAQRLCSEKHSSDPPLDAIECYQRVYHKWPVLLGEYISRKLSLQDGTQKRIQWCFAYALSPYCMTILLIGLCGIFVAISELAIVSVASRTLRSKASSAEIANIASCMDGILTTSLQEWALSANNYLNTTQQSINSEVFGWLYNASSALNETAAIALSDIDSAVADAFNGTLLYKPISGIVKCTIDKKLEKIQKAAVWVNTNAKLSFPPLDAVSLSKVFQSASNISNSTGFSDTTTSSIHLGSQARKSLQKILNQFKQIAITELIISSAILAIWIGQCLISVAIGFWIK
ncbi:LAMI_0F01750g1_1 [Lachancea mirantina]|uniref:Plasma membrane fusion protein PRM1 n=1 Tax=Lachancea mirantina TaxID=1230905 RepID=A0A1G4JWG3_9SACH|nr:LAMI_0F01750g1_1 [Lachancea mirantina]